MKYKINYTKVLYLNCEAFVHATDEENAKNVLIETEMSEEKRFPFENAEVVDLMIDKVTE